MNNYWLNKSKSNKFAILELMLSLEKKVGEFWYEDAAIQTFVIKIKDELDRLRNLGELFDYGLIHSIRCGIVSMTIGLKPMEKSHWVYLESKLLDNGLRQSEFILNGD